MIPPGNMNYFYTMGAGEDVVHLVDKCEKHMQRK